MTGRIAAEPRPGGLDVRGEQAPWGRRAWWSRAAVEPAAVPHVRVDHARDEFAKGPVHINGIEGFWGLAKVRLTKFKGLPKHTFLLHLKETEWRYNHRHANQYRCLLQYLRKNPLS